VVNRIAGSILIPLLKWDPIRNYSSVRSSSLTKSFWESDWVWVLLAIAALALLGALGTWALLFAQSRKGWKAFARRAEREALNAGERKVLTYMVRLAKLKNPESIFLTQAAFDAGQVRLEHSPQLAAMPKATRSELGSVLASLRKKLRYRPLSSLLNRTTTSRRVGVGAEVTMTCLTSGEEALGTVADTTAKLLAIEPRAPLRLRRGELWAIRCHLDGRFWEYQSPMKRGSDGMLYVSQTDTMHMVNQRRYPRAAVPRTTPLRCALAAVPDGGEQGDFVASNLLEIGGPGWLVETTLALEVEQEVLAELKKAEAELIQGRGVVRRVQPGAEGSTVVAIELLGLSREQMDVLLELTETAARQGEAEAEARAAEHMRAENHHETGRPADAANETDKWKTPSKEPSPASRHSASNTGP
jgi:hypothetical protein